MPTTELDAGAYVAYLRAYAQRFDLDVRLGVTVQHVKQHCAVYTDLYNNQQCSRYTSHTSQVIALWIV
jgi:lactam utilization protein B